MKKIYLFILLVFFYYSAKSQVITYNGPMNENIFLKMNGDEILSYVDCLLEIGYETKKINWISDKNFKRLSKLKNESSVLQVWKESSTSEVRYEYISKKKVLKESECLLTLLRDETKNESSIKLTFFY